MTIIEYVTISTISAIIAFSVYFMMLIMPFYINSKNVDSEFMKNMFGGACVACLTSAISIAIVITWKSLGQ